MRVVHFMKKKEKKIDLCDIHRLEMGHIHTHAAETFKLSNTSVTITCACCGCVVSRNRTENTLDLPGQSNRKNDRMFRKVTLA